MEEDHKLFDLCVQNYNKQKEEEVERQKENDKKWEEIERVAGLKASCN